jgi:hypothetical protein
MGVGKKAKHKAGTGDEISKQNFTKAWCDMRVLVLRARSQLEMPQVDYHRLASGCS